MAQVTRPPLPNQTPPYAEETADSRIGLQTGFLGTENVIRTFRVYCRNRTDNPVRTLNTLSSANGGVKLGEAFPTTDDWSDGTYVLMFFTIVDHWIGTSVWIVRGNYVPSYVLGYASQQWEFNIRGALQTQRIYTTLETDEIPSKGIGPPRYVPYPLSPTMGEPIMTWTARSPKLDDDVLLVLPGGGSDPTSPSLPRYMDGADSPTRASSINLWKIIPTWNFSAVSSAMQNRKYVNSDWVSVNTTSGLIPFVNKTDGIGTLLLDEISVDPVPPLLLTKAEAGIGPAFRIGITLKFDPDGWQHKLRHTYKFDDGTEAPIIDADGRYVEEEFLIAGETSITSILESFV